jgi:hypothetical protein
MNVSPSPHDLGRQVEAPPGDRPARRTGKGRSRFAWLAIGGGVLAAVMVVTVVAVLVWARGGATTVSPSVAGTWVGSGTISGGGPSGPIAFYLDLAMGANHRITGTSAGCASGVDASGPVTGAPGSSAGAYTMDFSTTDLGPGVSALHVSAQVIGSRMNLSGIATDTSTTPPTTIRVFATLTPGSHAAWVSLCNSQPTPVPTS